MTVIYKYLDCGDLHIAPGAMLEDLEEIFQYEVFQMLKKEGKITNAVIVICCHGAIQVSMLYRRKLPMRYRQSRICIERPEVHEDFQRSGQAGDAYSRPI